VEIGCGLVWVLVKVDWVGVWLGAHLVKGTFGDVLENPHYLSCLNLLQLEKKHMQFYLHMYTMILIIFVQT
jgi:hypothetical protein